MTGGPALVGRFYLMVVALGEEPWQAMQVGLRLAYVRFFTILILAVNYCTM